MVAVDGTTGCLSRHEPRRSIRSHRSLGETARARPLALRPLSRLAPALALSISIWSAGCQTFVSPITAWRAAYDRGLTRGPTAEEVADASGPTDSQSLMDRWLTPRRGPMSSAEASGSTLVLGSDGWRPMTKPPKDPKAEAEFQAALALFQQGKLAEAEKEFDKIARNRKGSNYGEDGQYYLAETQFQRKKYVAAHDSFEKLHADYPATDYLEKLVSREYEIAHLWLKQLDPKTPSQELIPWYKRFDGTLPIIDTSGYAVKALEHVRHNDPTGPLADDSAMELADFYLNHKDYESASIYYEQFLTDHSKSPLLQQVLHSAIEARMKAYLGPEYDASTLEKARELVKRNMQSFPEQQAGFEKLYHTLDLINDAEAEKTFKDGIYYKRRGKVASAEFCLGKIPQRWPNSPWAVKAKTELAQLAKLPRKPSKPSKIIIPPGFTDPFSGPGGMGGMGMGPMGMGPMGMGGMGMGGMGMGGPGMM
jgi:TolA-binding protein